MRHKKFIATILASFTLATGMMPVLAQDNKNVIMQPIPLQQEKQPYRLSKYDVINIVIVGFSENVIGLSGTSVGTQSADDGGTKSGISANDIIIGPDGYVNLPYAGSVKLAGLTIPEAQEVLAQNLGEYIKIPSLSIIVKQYGKRKVYVMGSVNKQGIYELSSEYMNIFAAISSAGGINNRGRTREIAVVRVTDGKVYIQKADLNKFIREADITQNVPLQDGDMVYVPKSGKIILAEDVFPLLSLYGIYKNITN